MSAVDGVTLDLQPGRIFGLVGESGCGKSTLANAVMGLLPSQAHARGSALLDGEEVMGIPEERLRQLRGDRMSMIFQDPATSLDPTFSVGEQVAETIRAHRAVSRRGGAGPGHRAHGLGRHPRRGRRYGDPPHRFSGGMRQRIVIAAALANDPALLIADEPTTALDVTIQAQILRLIAALCRDHDTAVLLITHDLGVVAQVCDQVGVMYAGQLVEQAPVNRLFDAPQHPYTQALLAALPSGEAQPGHLHVIPGQVPELSGDLPGCRFMDRCTVARPECTHPTAADHPRRDHGRLLGSRLADAECRGDDAVSPLLEVDGLVKDFSVPSGMFGRRTVSAVADVSLTVDPGEVLGLVGESGSGKTTLARCILGLAPPTSGSIRFDGVDVTTLRKAEQREFRRRVQPVFQDPFASLDPRWTVGRSVRESLDSYGIGTPADRDQRVLSLLDRVGLGAAYADRVPRQLSGGQRQRVGIAAALASEPDLIVADEPVSALDVSVQAQVLNLFADLQTGPRGRGPLRRP